MTRLPELERELLAAAERLDRARSPRRRWWRLPVLTVGASFVLAGGAIGAARLLPTGDPVPAAPLELRQSLPPSDPATFTVLSPRAADPEGGLPWAVALDRREGGRLYCAKVGRVQGDRLGIIGRDGAFADDGRFHPLSPDADQSGSCSGVAPDGEFISSSDGPPIPASGYTGSVINGSIGGCRERVRISRKTMSKQTIRKLRNVPMCAKSSMRIVKYGFAGPEAVRIDYGNRRVHLRSKPRKGENGAYVFVLTPKAAGSDPLVLKITYRDGSTCRQTRLQPSACPLPG